MDLVLFPLMGTVMLRGVLRSRYGCRKILSSLLLMCVAMFPLLLFVSFKVAIFNVYSHPKNVSRISGELAVFLVHLGINLVKVFFNSIRVLTAL